MYLQDALVWALYGDAWWPAVVARPEDHGQEPLSEEQSASYAFVVFLEDGSGTYLPVESLRDFDPNDSEKASNPNIAQSLAYAKQLWDAAHGTEEAVPVVEPTAEAQTPEEAHLPVEGESQEEPASNGEEDEVARRQRKRERKERKEKEREQERHQRHEEKKRRKEAAREAERLQAAAEAGEAINQSQREEAEGAQAEEDSPRAEEAPEEEEAARGGVGVDRLRDHPNRYTAAESNSFADVDRRYADSLYRLRMKYAEQLQQVEDNGYIMSMWEGDMLEVAKRKIRHCERLVAALTARKSVPNLSERELLDIDTSIERLNHNLLEDLEAGPSQLLCRKDSDGGEKKGKSHFFFRDPALPRPASGAEPTPVSVDQLPLSLRPGHVEICSFHRYPVMEQWQSFRDFDPFLRKDVQAVAAFGAVPRQFDPSIRTVEEKASQLARKSGLELPEEITRVPTHLRLSNFDPRATLADLRPSHIDSSIQLSASAVHSSVPVPSKSSLVRMDDQFVQEGPNDVHEEPTSQLPEVSTMWAIPQQEATPKGPSQPALQATANRPTPQRSSSGQAGAGTPHNQTLSAMARKSWTSAARPVVIRVLHEYYDGKRPKLIRTPQEFSTLCKKLLDKAYTEILSRSKKARTMRRNALSADDFTEEHKKLLKRSIVVYIEKKYASRLPQGAVPRTGDEDMHSLSSSASVVK